MTLRRLSGLLLALLSAWVLWGAIHTVIVITSRGSPLSDALFQPPTSIVRIIAAGTALVGGLILVADWSLGAITSLIGALLFALLAGLMILSGASSVLWRDEAVIAVLMIVLSVVALFQARF